MPLHPQNRTAHNLSAHNCPHNPVLNTDRREEDQQSVTAFTKQEDQQSVTADTKLEDQQSVTAVTKQEGQQSVTTVRK